MTGSAEDGQATQQDELVIYRCTQCGKLSVSLGWLHGHIEKHQGFGPFNLIPDPRKMANPDALNEKTEAIRVTDYETGHPNDFEVTP